MEISVSWLRQHKVVVIASLRSERSLVVRTLGINEVRPLSNFDGLVKTFFPPIFQNSCTTIVLRDRRLPC